MTTTIFDYSANLKALPYSSSTASLATLNMQIEDMQVAHIIKSCISSINERARYKRRAFQKYGKQVFYYGHNDYTVIVKPDSNDPWTLELVFRPEDSQIEVESYDRVIRSNTVGNYKKIRVYCSRHLQELKESFLDIAERTISITSSHLRDAAWEKLSSGLVDEAETLYKTLRNTLPQRIKDKCFIFTVDDKSGSYLVDKAGLSNIFESCENRRCYLSKPTVEHISDFCLTPVNVDLLYSPIALVQQEPYIGNLCVAPYSKTRVHLSERVMFDSPEIAIFPVSGHRQKRSLQMVVVMPKSLQQEVIPVLKKQQQTLLNEFYNCEQVFRESLLRQRTQVKSQKSDYKYAEFLTKIFAQFCVEFFKHIH